MSMNLFVRDLDFRASTSMPAILRWQVGCHCLAGSSWPSTAPEERGLAIAMAWPSGRHRRKERTSLEIVGEGSRARLVIVTGEVGGRWSLDAANFMRASVVAQARDAPNVL